MKEGKQSAFLLFKPMETRRALRININLKIKSNIPEEYRQKFALTIGSSFEVDAVDISVLGVGIFSKYFLPKGLILELEISGDSLEMKENMIVKAEVRHCAFLKGKGYRCGVQFLNLPSHYKKAIADFITTYERRKEPRLKLSE